MARHPGATTRQVAQTLGVSERRVTANLDRLTGDGPLMVAPQTALPEPRAHLPTARPSGHRARDAAGNIADDRRFAKPAIVRTIGAVRADIWRRLGATWAFVAAFSG
ncbi:hypothetical protein GCM10020256_10130 [Streptomyces thermocoprophilus]